MYVVIEYTTLLFLTAFLLSLLLVVSVVLMTVQEGLVTVWRVSRRIAGNGRQWIGKNRSQVAERESLQGGYLGTAH